MKRKNLILICLVVIIVILIVILVWNRKTATAPTVISTMPITTSTATSSSPAASSTSGMTVTVAISTSTAKTYSNDSFSLVYPAGWSVFATPSFSLDTFNGNYDNGGIIPPGGAEIDVVTTTVYSGSAQGIMATELMSAVNMTTSTITVDGVSCNKASYQDTYTSQISSQNVALYCLRGTELWKIYLSYRANDPAGQAHLSDFNSILRSMKLLPD